MIHAKGVDMEIIKTIAYILAGILLCTAWFIAFALGYILQGTWACIPCMAACFAIGMVLAKLISGGDTENDKKDGEIEMIYNDYMYNQRFREYVDKYCQKHGCTVDEALTHELVRQAWRHYTEV